MIVDTQLTFAIETGCILVIYSRGTYCHARKPKNEEDAASGRERRSGPLPPDSRGLDTIFFSHVTLDSRNLGHNSMSDTICIGMIVLHGERTIMDVYGLDYSVETYDRSWTRH
ncbi:hypothetical protein BJX99DRAFT_125496 [Aspergillus californicus]